MSARKERLARTALLHVADRTGVVEFAHALLGLGFELVATGPTATALRHAGIPHKTVSDFVGERLPADALGLLHPKLIAAITDEKPRVDLVAVNLYPLSAATSDPALTQDEVLGYVDPVGPALLRAAARNFKLVIPLCDPDDYQQAVDTLKSYDRMLPDRRQTLAAKAFHYCAYYDSTVAQYLGGQWEEFPDEVVIALKKSADLRYGENPHQSGAFYTLSGARPWGLNAAKLHLGRPLVYGHYLDLETAWELVNAFHEPACAIVKHGVPAGFACGEDLAKAARRAYAGDPRGCFRGTAAVNAEVGAAAAEFFAEEFVSCIAAPEFSPKALQLLKTKKDIRLVTLPSKLISAHELDLRAVAGGMLVQERDSRVVTEKDLTVVTKKQPTKEQVRDLLFAWRAVKSAKSNAIVFVKDQVTIGIGSGQTSRVDATWIAAKRAGEKAKGAVMASDAFFPFPDSVEEAAKHGIAAIVQPGGSMRDAEVFKKANELGIAMVVTGVRGFRH